MLNRQYINQVLTKSFAEEQLRAFHAVVTKPGDVLEVRIPKPFDRRHGTISGYFDDVEAFVAAVRAYVVDVQAPGVYVTVNQVNPALLARAPNQLLDHAEHTTSDRDILRRRFLFIDVDPVRPTGISATDAERAAALDATDAIIAYLSELGWPEPAAAGSSGNGGAIFYRIDLPNSPESTQLVTRILKRLAALFDTDAVTIDTTVSNAARIVKLPGTAAAKGRPTADRPWRSAVMETNPDAEVVDLGRLEALAGPAEPDRASSSKKDRNRDSASRTASGRFDVEALLDAQGIGYDYKKASYGDVWPLHRCLTSDEHDTGACIIQFASGAVAYRCQHASCQDKTWADVKAALGIAGKGGATGGTTRDLRFLTIEELRARPRPAWLIRDVLRQASLAMLVGDFGTYKSFVALAWALALATGRDWLGHRVTAGAVAYVAAEGAAGLVDRCDAWARHEGCALPERLHILGEAIDLVGDNQPILDALAGIEGLALVVIDTVARTFVGNENLQEDANAYVAAADRIKAATGAAVLLVHHNNRQGEYRGSTVIPGALDTMIGAEKTARGVRLACLKMKDAEPFRCVHLEKKVVELGDAAGEGDDAPIDLAVRSSLVFVPVGSEPGGAEAFFSTLTEHERSLLKALKAANETDGAVSTSRWEKTAGVSSATFYRLRSALIQAGWVTTTRRGSSSFNEITDAGRQVLEPKANPFGQESSHAAA